MIKKFNSSDSYIVWDCDMHTLSKYMFQNPNRISAYLHKLSRVSHYILTTTLTDSWEGLDAYNETDIVRSRLQPVERDSSPEFHICRGELVIGKLQTYGTHMIWNNMRHKENI